MKKKSINADIFAAEFTADPGGRQELVDGLVASEGRLLINLPGRGAARHIAERLREGPFSVFYDFEMLLARRLHPRLAGLKLNIIADIRVNALFDERYRPYAADTAAALDKGGGMSRLREVITRMVLREGHRMALKFCDLIVRWSDPGLYRTLRPVEACVMSMKEDRRTGVFPGFDRISGLYEEFAAKEGGPAAGALLARMAWDAELREFVPGLEEASRNGATAREGAASGNTADWQDEAGPGADDGLADGGTLSVVLEDSMPEDADRGEVEEDVSDEGPGEGGEAERPAAGGGAAEMRTRKYARILKNDYLDMKSPGDEAGIRRLMEKIEKKNGAAFGEVRAAEIVDDVLTIWAEDVSIDSVKRSLIRSILEERRFGPVSENAAGPEIDDLLIMRGEGPHVTAPSGEGPVSNDEMEALLNEFTPEPAKGGTGEAPADLSDGRTRELDGTVHPADFALEDAAEVAAGLDAEAFGETGGGSSGQAADEESFLISDLAQTGIGGKKRDPAEVSDESYIIGQDPILEIPAEESAKKEALSSSDDSKVELIDVFTIKDEVLFQDNAEKRRKTMQERSRKGMRITKIDISGPDES